MDMIRLITQRVFRMHREDMINEATNYSSMEDDDLVALANKGDRRAANEILKKYQTLPKTIIQGYKNKNPEYKKYFLKSGGDEKDLAQIALIKLSNSLKNYQPGKNKNFKNFAWLVMERGLMDALDSANAKKHSAMNSAYDDIDRIENRGRQNTQLRKSTDDKEHGTYQLSHSLTPEKIMMNKEARNRLLAYLKKNLTPWQQQVLDLHLKDMKYDEIAAKLGKDNKAINNAMNMIRSKTREYVNRYRECKIAKALLESLEFDIKLNRQSLHECLFPALMEK